MAINGNGGLALRNWGDLLAVATLLAMLLGVVAWGLKLEGELNSVRDDTNHRLSNLESRVADGILPRAEERIEFQRKQIDKLEKNSHDH